MDIYGPHVFQHEVYQVHAKSDGAALCDYCDRREWDSIHVDYEPCKRCAAKAVAK